MPSVVQKKVKRGGNRGGAGREGEEESTVPDLE